MRGRGCRRKFYRRAIGARAVVDIDEARLFARLAERAGHGVIATQPLGQRLVDGAAKKMADDFFDKFSDLAGGKVHAPENREPARGPLAAPAPANDNGSRNAFEPPSWIPIAIIGGAILFLLVVLLR